MLKDGGSLCDDSLSELTTLVMRIALKRERAEVLAVAGLLSDITECRNIFYFQEELERIDEGGVYDEVYDYLYWRYEYVG